MKTRTLLLCALTIFAPFAIQVHAADWPQWRGASGVNHAGAGASAPVEWTKDMGVAWRTAIPGLGNSSPTLVGDRIYLTAGDEEAETQSLLILDRENGELLDEIIVHKGNLPKELFPKNTHANSTVASDGQRVFAMFLNDEAPILTAFDLDGSQIWQQRVPGEARIHFEYGFGSSPVVIDDLVIVAAEFNRTESGIYAFNVETGQRVWHTPRPQQFSYSSPTLASVDGKQILLMCGNSTFSGYDVATGAPLWSREATTMATCGTMAWDQALKLGFACGGHPDAFVSAVDLQADHQVIWRHRVKCYEQSVLTVKGYVYAVADAGVVYCWRASDGKEMWKQRLRGNFSSSPILVGDNIYVANESGTTFVFEANPEEFVQLAKNRLGDRSIATLVPVDDRLYYRFSEDGQDFLAAIGPKRKTSESSTDLQREYSVLVATGGHDYDKPEFKSMLESLGNLTCDFVLTEEMQTMKSVDIAADYDAMVMMDMVRDKVDDQNKMQFVELARSGVGMVFLHFTLASRPYWDGYHSMIGGKFFLPKVEKDANLHSTYSTDMKVGVRVLNPAHPVTAGMVDFSITDAFYGNIAISPETTPLLASENSRTAATIGWTHRYRSSKVVFLMPGYTAKAYENENYRNLIRNAISYVAQ